MNRPVDDPLEATHQTTVLDRVRPTVVVRRRVYEPQPQPARQAGSPNITDAGAFTSADDDENGPPSSVNVARALASLRADELHRLEEILGDEADDEDDESDDDEEAGAEVDEVRAGHAPHGHGAEATKEPIAAPAPPAGPSVKVGPTIAVAELARRMSAPVQEVVTSLVTRGFFSVTVKASLPRETARAAATLFGYRVEETDEVEAAHDKPKAKHAVPKPRGGGSVPKVGASLSAPARSKPHAKPAKKKTATRAR